MIEFFRRRQAAVLFLLLLIASSAFGQNYPSQEVFGKNRVQYKDFQWRLFSTSNYDIFFYRGGENLAKMTAQIAEIEFDRITEILGYTPYNRIKIFLYNSPEELQQSNMGVASFGDFEDKQIDLAQSRVEIAFTGDQMSFRKQMVYDISRLFAYDMLYGGNLKDALQSSILLTLPNWFMTGIASYVAYGWSPELNDYTRDLTQNRQVRRPSLLEGKDATMIGHSIWNYIAEQYGKDKISNILNLTRIIRAEETSITSTLGLPSFSRFLKGWREFYVNFYEQEKKQLVMQSTDWKYKIGNLDKQAQGGIVKLSNDGKLLAISESHKRSYRIIIKNLETGKQVALRHGGLLSDDSPRNKTLPLIGWTKDNSLAVILQRQGSQNLYLYDNVQSKRPKIRFKRAIRGLDQIVDMDISSDGAMLAVSADRAGQNDLFLISVSRATPVPLTNDLYDDLSPRFVGATRQVVFASNRSDDSLKSKGSLKQLRNYMGLFKHEGNSRNPMLTRLVDSLGTYVLPVSATKEEVIFTSDAPGIVNIFKYEIASKKISQITSSITSLVKPSINSTGKNTLAYLELEGGDLWISLSKSFDANKNTSGIINFAKEKDQYLEGKTVVPDSSKTDSLNAPSEPLAEPRLSLRQGEVDIYNYQFDEDVLRQSTGVEPSLNSLGTRRAPISVPKRKRETIAVRGPFPYTGLFLSNDALSNWRIDPIKRFGLVQSISMNDLLENHVIKAGVFLSFSNFRSHELYAEYNMNRYRVDFGARIDRNNLYLEFFESGQIQKYRFNKFSVTASYPFSTTSRLSISPTYANTRRIDLGFNGPDVVSNFLGARTEFVFDNTISNAVSFLDGTRLKIRMDNFLGLTNAAEGFFRISGDLRHYQKVHRNIVFAVRLAGSHSGGRSPKLSTMGGMENWIGNRIDPANNRESPDPLDFGVDRDNRDFFFTEFATNLRGFNLNRLSGSSYMLLNAELRIPIIEYLIRRPITSSFLRNFQINAFSDIGTAWTGAGPWTQENSLNTEIIGGNGAPFRATVVNFRNPYLIGYGLGLRTSVFGVYAKLDVAWGLDNTVVQKPIPYITLGYDF